MHCSVYPKGARSTGLVALLLIIWLLALSSAAWSGQEGQPGAALIVTVASKKAVTVAGSGFKPKESIKLVIIGKQGADWGIGPPGGFKANESGAFEAKLTKRQVQRLPSVLIKEVNVYTIKATGSEGTVATAPFIRK